jgi:ABC-type nickel/cobalt efflux system permease component RcnA
MAAAGDWKVMLAAIFGVFVAISSLLLIAWTFKKGAERTQSSPRLRKAFFAAVAALYAIWMVFDIVKVILGKESTEALRGLPGGLLLLGLFWMVATKVRTRS